VIRTREAGSIRATDEGINVVLAGWIARRRDHGGVAFFDVRDASGIVQVVIHDAEVAHDLKNETCVQITGTVSIRPAGNENADLPTGAIEVVAENVVVLSTSAPLPFQIDDQTEVGEEARLKWRYLDLRRSGPAKALRMRSEANRIAREVLQKHNFVEIETPTLTASTPEGARNVVRPATVPTAVQATADGGWHGALLPDCSLLPRRRLPRRSSAGVHPARY
jgi:aspartyl-tRNA synthetase